MAAEKPQNFLGGSASCSGLIRASLKDIWSCEPGKVSRKTEHQRTERFGYQFADNGMN